MSHNNNEVIDLGEKSILEFEDSLLDDDEGDVGGLNHTPSLVKPLVMVILFLVLGSYSPFVVT
jgi:hypothetical protein